MWRRFTFVLVMLASSIAVALAQTTETPVMGSTGTGVAGEAEQPVQILVIGDALAGGLGAGLQRMADPKAYVVTSRFNEESGLARPEVYDWGERLPKILESNAYDAIVVMLGSNDRQQIRDGNARYAFGSPEWTEVYRARTDRMLDQLTESGAKIYWIGLPAMGDDDYDTAVQAISTLQKFRAEAKEAKIIDMRPIFVAAGSYTDTGKDNTGAVVKLRGRDGVSFYKQGNNRMGQIVLDAIVETTRDVVASAEEPVDLAADPALARAPLAERSVPEFGQSLLFGETLTLRPRDISTTALLVLGRGSNMTPAEATAALASITQPGSVAAALFNEGIVAKPPVGRVDDFAVPPKPPAE